MLSVECQEAVPGPELCEAVVLRGAPVVHLLVWGQVGVAQQAAVRAVGRVQQVPRPRVFLSVKSMVEWIFRWSLETLNKM